MKEINTKQKAFLHLAAVIALSLLFLSTNVQKAESFSSTDALAAVGSNATRISDCLLDTEEFLMESETGRRILQAGKGKTITYGATNPKMPFCNGGAKGYSGCVGEKSKSFTNRPCTSQNFCGRKGQ